jgi:SAM-dependent methyltransferase
MESTRRFYDDLAADYHLVYADWEGAIRSQARALGELLERRGLGPPASIWDCTCGIGTQALGLAELGYRVAASDLSPGAIARARKEARRRGLEIELSVRDVRGDPPAAGPFDAVISSDNSLPHLLTDGDLRAALGSMAAALVAGGTVLLGMRDYDALVASRPGGTVPTTRATPDGRAVVFQIWEWAEDGRSYEVHLFVLHETGGRWRVSEHTTTYRALLRSELSALMHESGYRDVEWLMPEESGLFQPVAIGTRE